MKAHTTAIGSFELAGAVALIVLGAVLAFREHHRAITAEIFPWVTVPAIGLGSLALAFGSGSVATAAYRAFGPGNTPDLTLFIGLGVFVFFTIFFVLFSIAGGQTVPHTQSNRSRVTGPPGGWLLSLVDNVCREATSDLVSQMVADMRVEHFDALAAGRPIKAEWMRALHYVSIARALSVDRVLSAVVNYALGVWRAGKH